MPNTSLVEGIVELDSQGYVVTDNNHQTSVDGVYAAGDLCVKNLRQVVTAVSDGAVAATASEKYISALHDRLHLPAFSRPEVDEARLMERKQAVDAQKTAGEEDGAFISADIREKLVPIFAKFERQVIVKGWLDDSDFSAELADFLGELATLTDKVQTAREPVTDGMAPGLEILYDDGTSSGIVFHSVPGGHEFNSFNVALYNVAGPGQALSAAAQHAVAAIDAAKKPVDIKVMVSLSCTMCPEVVMGSQRLAAASPYITASMYDIQHFPDIKQQYRIMSVPCMVVNDRQVFFGKKIIDDIAALIAE